MTTYLGIRNEAVEHIKKHFENQKVKLTVEATVSSFDEAELKRMFVKTPAVYISLVSIEDRLKNDESYMNFNCFVVVQASQVDKLYDNGLKITGSLIQAIKTLDCGAFGYDTQELNAECIYNGALGNLNACLWAVSFRWKVRSVSAGGENGEILDTTDLEYFDGYDATHEVGKQEVKDKINI